MKLHEMFDEPRKPRRNRTQGVNETSPQMKNMEKNRNEDQLRAELEQAQIDGTPEQVEKLKRELAGLTETANGDLEEDMRTDRMLQSMTPPAGARPSSKLDLSKKKKKKHPTTKANEEAEEIKSRDPRITAMLKKARVNYAGAAADDLSALVSMMNDEQKTQDSDIDNLDRYNGSQDVEIDHEEGVNNDQAIEIGDLAARIKKLENERAPSRDTNEEIVPDGDEFLDNETGEIFRADQVEKDASGQYKEKEYEPEPMQYEPDDDDDDYDFMPTPSTRSTTDKHTAMSMFGDVAAGGGDPIDYLMGTYNMDMEEIDALAREQGYEDANEWAESYTQNEMESIISNANKLNNR